MIALGRQLQVFLQRIVGSGDGLRRGGKIDQTEQWCVMQRRGLNVAARFLLNHHGNAHYTVVPGKEHVELHMCPKRSLNSPSPIFPWRVLYCCKKFLEPSVGLHLGVYQSGGEVQPIPDS